MKGEWSSASQRKHTLSWFRESVILSLCGDFTSRKRAPSTRLAELNHPMPSLSDLTKHQVIPISQIPHYPSTISATVRCVRCSTKKRTACSSCDVPLCYPCGQTHLQELLTIQTSDHDQTPQLVLALAPEDDMYQSPTFASLDPTSPHVSEDDYDSDCL